MRIRPLAALLTVALLPVAAATAAAQDRWRFDFENGAAISGYNDVAIPGNTGTRFSMTDDLTSDTEYFWRVRADFRFAPKHVLSGLVAPLTIILQAASTLRLISRARPSPRRPDRRYLDVQLVSRDLSLRAVAERHLDVRLRRFREGPRRRDPSRVEREGGRKTDLGVVPLINFKFERRLGARAAFLLEGDALAARRAARGHLRGHRRRRGERWSIKAGYRFLEGGADNDEVYTFAAVHYVAAGVVFRF